MNAPVRLAAAVPPVPGPRSSTRAGSLRLLHLDLLVLLGLGISLFFYNRAEITASVGLTYPVLIYFFARDARGPGSGRGSAPAR